MVNYKKIIPNRELRLKILGLTNFIPDKSMIRLQYKIATGNRLNLKNPKKFTEKLQWYKLYYRDPLMTQCADKYGVREYVKSKGYEDILIPLYGNYDYAENIDFDNLPNKFVLKTTNGSHTNILCDNKKNLDKEATINKLNNWIKKRPIKAGREWAYYDIHPKIICEKYLEKDENNEIIDYKFFCFNGKTEYLLICKNRFSSFGLKKGFFDINFNFIDIGVNEYDFTDEQGNKIILNRPENFEKMVEIAEELAKDFPHVRVDLYNIKGAIYFGELTFYHASGYKDYKEFDFILGDKFIV